MATLIAAAKDRAAPQNADPVYRDGGNPIAGFEAPSGRRSMLGPVTSIALSFQPAVQPPPGCRAPDFFHLDGEPMRAALAERALFGSTLTAPILGLLDTRQWAVSGVYLLIAARHGSAVPGTPVGVYVGSAKDLIDRVSKHAANKPDWQVALLLTGAGVTRGDAYQLERALGDSMSMATTPNVVAATWQRLPEFSAYDVPWHVRDSFIILAERCLGHLGIPVRLLIP